MDVVISGASGLIGTALTHALQQEGHQVRRLVRRPARAADEASWDPASGTLDVENIRGADVIISLGGASVGRLPWTAGYKNMLINTRLEGTRTIVQALLTLAEQGKSVPMFISASASGFYGSAPGVALTEQSSVGSTFLAKLCSAWEAEANRAMAVTDVALLRTSPVLHPQGVLRPLILLTKLGLGGRLASGKQFWPWISLDDEVRAIMHVMHKRITGPVNLAGPVAATNAQISRLLAQKLKRPSLLPVPAFMLRFVLGKDAADSLLLNDARIVPATLQDTGFQFTHSTAEEAIVSLSL